MLKELFPGSRRFTVAIFKIPQISKHFSALLPPNSKVSLVAEAFPGLIYRYPLGDNSSFHSKIKVQTVLMSACFDNALILKITLGKIIVSHQNDNLSLTFLLLTKISILTGPKIQWHIRKFNNALTK